MVRFSLTCCSAVETCSEEGCLALSLLELLALNLLFTFLSSILVLMEPVSAGSGIPEIKSYLNGVKVPGIVRLRTYICKVTGVLFAVSAGLFVGKEGPMIHSGAIVGAGLPQFQSITFRKIHFDFPYFRSDSLKPGMVFQEHLLFVFRDKRDFVSAGAAAGVAAAFGAPIGGTLFSLEEGSSFWNQALTWKVVRGCVLRCSSAPCRPHSPSTSFGLGSSSVNGDPSSSLDCSTSESLSELFSSSVSSGPLWLLFLAQSVECGRCMTVKSDGLGSTPGEVPGLALELCPEGEKACHLWTAVDLGFFVLMGVVGGLLGALFNCINKRLSKYRLRNVHPKARFIRLLESLLVCMVTTLVIFMASITLGECRDLVSTEQNNTATQGSVSEEANSTVRQFFCFNNTYNDMATLFFNPQETAIHRLFHQNVIQVPPLHALLYDAQGPESERAFACTPTCSAVSQWSAYSLKASCVLKLYGRKPRIAPLSSLNTTRKSSFSPVTLALFFLLYFVLSCWTYGVSVPSGLFVPCLLCGASLGRLAANVLKINFQMQIYSGTFALIGAAAFLGGVVRMTISLTVILIESTNEITYGLPIMITLMVAKWTGDFFNEGIYDIHIHLKGVPLLEWETEVEMDKLTASDLMEPHLTYVYPHTRIQSLVSILRTTVHHAFPVVTENRENEKEFMKGNVLISNNIRFKEPDGRAHVQADRRAYVRTDLRPDGHTHRLMDVLTDRQTELLIIPSLLLGSGLKVSLCFHPQKSSVVTRAGEQSRRCQSMKSYPSSELRNVCDEHLSADPGEESQDVLQQMLERRHVPYPNLYPDQSPSEEWSLEERFRPLTLHGLVLRSQLVNLLIRGVCYAENQSVSASATSRLLSDVFLETLCLELSAAQPRLSHSEMTEDYPRFPDVHDLDLTLLNPRMIVDVTPYMNPAPYTVSPNTHVSQVFNLFRTMGLRHLPVVNAVGEIVGIITRHNLTHEFLVAKLRQHSITI
ncbi:hypothetical protein DNTS_015424 [Danionella cerebrum]|uniref:Chloride channel protein n=1 Tax=Danionella cerebrum TaxID=2873325 RepID=A0A553R3Y0_9TELE|nr:hypothetical protein DNTS_015424 [Danionella translucida]